MVGALVHTAESFGFYAHYFDQPAASVRQLQDVRRWHPDSPVFICSDGGLDFGRACQAIGNCRFEWRPPANARLNPKPFFERFRAAVLWLRTTVVVYIEPDVKIVRSIVLDPPKHLAAGGVADVWNNALTPQLRAYMEAAGQRHRPAYRLLWPRWGFTGGMFVRADVALDALDADLIDWEAVERLQGPMVYDSDVAMAIMLACRGHSYEPWDAAGDRNERERGEERKHVAFEHGGNRALYNTHRRKEDEALVQDPPSHGYTQAVTCRGCIWRLDAERLASAHGGFALNTTRASPEADDTRVLGSGALRRRHELCFFWPTYPPHFAISALRVLLQRQQARVRNFDGVPAAYIMFDTAEIMAQFCAAQGDACQTEGAHGFTLESLISHADFGRLYAALSHNAYTSWRKCSKAGWGYWQAIKKLIGTMALVDSCKRVWLADADTLPFRSFSVQEAVAPHTPHVLWPIADWSRQPGCSGHVAGTFGQLDCVSKVASHFQQPAMSHAASTMAFGGSDELLQGRVWWESNDFWMTTPRLARAAISRLLPSVASGASRNLVTALLERGPVSEVSLYAFAAYAAGGEEARTVNLVEELGHALPTTFGRCCKCAGHAAAANRRDMQGTRVAVEGGAAPCWMAEHLVAPCFLRSTDVDSLGHALFSRLGMFSINPNMLLGSPSYGAEAFRVLTTEPSIAFVHNNILSPSTLRILLESNATDPNVKRTLLLPKYRALFTAGEGKVNDLLYLQRATDSTGGATGARSDASQVRACDNIKVNFLDETVVTSDVQFCVLGPRQQVTGSNWLNEHHELLVSWITLHPTVARGVYIDVGANAGIFSALAASSSSVHFDRVFSVEPQPGCAASLRHMVRHNKRTSSWHVINAALGREGPSQSIQVPSKGCGMGWEANKNFKERDAKVPVLPLTRLIKLAEEQQPEDSSKWPANSPYFMKIDVDGAEVEVVEAILELMPEKHSHAPSDLVAPPVGRLRTVPELYVEINMQNWQNFGRSFEEGAAAFERLATYYLDIFLLSALPVTCEGHYKDLAKHTSPFREVGRGSYNGKPTKASILRVHDFVSILRGCIHIENTTKRGGDGQVNMWFVPRHRKGRAEG